MSIKIKCPECGRVANAPDGAIGRTAKCPGCGSKILVAHPAAKSAGDFALDATIAPSEMRMPAQTTFPSKTPRSRVQGPAIALIVTAVIGIGFSLIMAVQSLFFMGEMPQFHQDIGKLVGQQHQDKPEQAKFVQDAMGLNASLLSMSGKMQITMAVISVVGSGIVLYAALSMMSLRRYPLAVTGSILAMVPMLGPCCVLGLPFGIWALVMLCQPDVRSAFS